MSADVFSLLTSGGIKFDKKRFIKDIDAFKPKPAAPISHLDTSVSRSKGSKGAKTSGSATAGHGGHVGHGGVDFGEEDEGTDIHIYGTEIDESEDEEDQEEGEEDNGEEEKEERVWKCAPRDPSCPAVSTRDYNEEANVIRKAYKIKITGTDLPCPLRCFAELGTRFKAGKRHTRNLQECGFSEPTPIQRQAVPALMNGRDLLAIAPTGSGKTLAFLVPIVAGLRSMRLAGDCPKAVKALVVSPTHELAAQQARVLKLLLPGTALRACLLSKSTAAGSDFSKVDILLANPLRVTSLVDSKKLDLSQCRFLILDEADKLFELGFMDQIDGVLTACSHKDVVRALFSATLPEKVEDLARSVLQLPLRITVGARNTANSLVKQRLLFVGKESGKLMTLRQLLTQGLKPPVLVFVASKERAKALHTELKYDGVHVDSIAADQSAAARSAAVEGFRSGRTWVLIATDLIGRGMDFIGVNTVINYDFPNSTIDYIHRVGRTGRAGNAGEAVTFFTEDDSGQLRSVAQLVKDSGGEVPAWMLHLKKAERDAKRKRLPSGVTAADDISTIPKLDRIKMKHKQQMIEQSKAKKQRMMAQKSGQTPSRAERPGASSQGRKQQPGEAREGPRRGDNDAAGSRKVKSDKASGVKKGKGGKGATARP